METYYEASTYSITLSQEHAALQGVSHSDFFHSRMDRFDPKQIKKMAGDAFLG